MLLRPGYGLSSGQHIEGGPSYMDSVVASCVIDLDATIEASYDGSSQTWTNLISGQSVYDMQLGNSAGSDADDPAFTGTAGDAGAYFLCDGNQWFTLTDFTGSLIENWVRTDASYPAWVAIAIRTAGTLANGDAYWGNASSTSEYGMSLRQEADGTLQIDARAGSQNNQDIGITLSTSTDYVIVLTWNANAGTMEVWTETLNNAPTISFNANSTNSSDDFSVLARGQVADTITGARLYAFSAGEEVLDATKAQAIIDEYSSHHSRSYS